MFLLLHNTDSLLTSLQDEAGVCAPVSHHLSEDLWRDERKNLLCKVCRAREHLPV